MRSLELFAGAGGLGMGLHAAGFRPECVIERDRDCCAVLDLNKARGARAIRDWKIISEDVRTLNFKAYEDKLELVSGGPPCQPFSLGGKHRAHEDARDMFPEAVRTLREVRPAAFIFENVKGLTRDRFRNYFEYIRLQMTNPEIVAKSDEDWSDHLSRLERHFVSGAEHGLRYRVVVRLLNAADYGVPQKRERVFFVGFREDLGLEWSFPEQTHSALALLLDQSSRGAYWDRHGISRSQRFYAERDALLPLDFDHNSGLLPWVTVRDAISDLPLVGAGKRTELVTEGHRYQPGARVYPGHTGSPMDEPAKALKAGVHGVPGGENMLVHRNGEVRYFTMREAARVQTFPDDFIFAGSWSETMRQLGNAVPVKLSRVVGESVARQLLAKRSGETVH